MGQPLVMHFPVPVDGERLDYAPHECPPTALRLAQNLLLREGEVGTRPGLEEFAVQAGEKVIAVEDFGGKVKKGSISPNDTLVIMGTANWYRYNAGAWTSLSGTLASANHGIFRIFDKAGTSYLLGINSRQSVLKYWDGAAGSISSAAGSPPKAKVMVLLGDRVILANLSANGAYSGATGPLAFATSAQNDFESGWNDFHGRLDDTPGDIVAGLEMGNLQAILYKSDAVISLVAQAGQQPFHPEWRRVNAVGPANERCVFEVGDGSHLYLGPDAQVYRFDGVNVEPFPIYIRKSIMRIADKDLDNIADNAWGFYNRMRNEAWFFFKGASSNVDKAVVINLSNLSCWPQSYAALGGNSLTAGGQVQIPSDTMPRMVLFYHTTGQTFKEGTYQDNGQTTSASLRTPVTDYGVPGVYKTLREMKPRLQHGVYDPWLGDIGGASAPTLSVIVAATANNGNFNENAEVGQSITLDSGATSEENSTNHRLKSEMHGITLSGNFAWRYRGMTLRARMRSVR